jgi:hypothetical protein
MANSIRKGVVVTLTVPYEYPWVAIDGDGEMHAMSIKPYLFNTYNKWIWTQGGRRIKVGQYHIKHTQPIEQGDSLICVEQYSDKGRIFEIAISVCDRLYESAQFITADKRGIFACPGIIGFSEGIWAHGENACKLFSFSDGAVLGDKGWDKSFVFLQPYCATYNDVASGITNRRLGNIKVDLRRKNLNCALQDLY